MTNGGVAVDTRPPLWHTEGLDHQRLILMERTARKIAWIALWSLTALTAGQALAQDWARDMFDHK